MSFKCCAAYHKRSPRGTKKQVAISLCTPTSVTICCYYNFYPKRSKNTYKMVKCGRCFATYHLGMIYAIIQVGTIGNRTGPLGMPDLHADHYTIGIGKVFFLTLLLQPNDTNDCFISDVKTLYYS